MSSPAETTEHGWSSIHSNQIALLGSQTVRGLLTYNQAVIGRMVQGLISTLHTNSVEGEAILSSLGNLITISNITFCFDLDEKQRIKAVEIHFKNMKLPTIVQRIETKNAYLVRNEEVLGVVYECFMTRPLFAFKKEVSGGFFFTLPSPFDNKLERVNYQDIIRGFERAIKAECAIALGPDWIRGIADRRARDDLADLTRWSLLLKCETGHFDEARMAEVAAGNDIMI